MWLLPIFTLFSFFWLHHFCPDMFGYCQSWRSHSDERWTIFENQKQAWLLLTEARRIFRYCNEFQMRSVCNESLFCCLNLHKLIEARLELSLFWVWSQHLCYSYASESFQHCLWNRVAPHVGLNKYNSWHSQKVIMLNTVNFFFYTHRHTQTLNRRLICFCVIIVFFCCSNDI